MRQSNRGNLPAAMLVLALLMLWQAAAMGMDAAYILPGPVPCGCGNCGFLSFACICPQP